MNTMKNARADPVAFLYRRYGDRVYSLSFHLLGSFSAAEKATATVFVTLAHHLDQAPDPKDFEDWLKRTTVAVALGLVREDMRRSQALHEVELADERVEPRMPLDKRSLDTLELELAIRKLPVAYRFVFVLHDIERFSHEKIATMLGWTTDSVKAAAARARLELRRLLSSRGADAPSVVGKRSRH